MEIVHEEADLQRYMREAVKVSNDSPVLLDRFLNDAIEVDVDALSDGTDVLIGGIMEHIEQAGVHSGDSACSLPPYSLSPRCRTNCAGRPWRWRRRCAWSADERAVRHQGRNDVYVLEVNPRASRTVPFVSKATGRPLAKIAARCMTGAR
jgi:carbamoyl-phosphate synthase large subunit